MLRFTLLLITLPLLALSAQTVRAQPSAEALLQAWLDDWEDAAAALASVGYDETHTRTIDGPRGTLEVLTRGTLQVFADRRPRRTVELAWVNDEPIDLDKRTRMERRLRHALGRAAMDLRRPASLPYRVLASAEPMGGVDDVRLGTTPAWEVPLARPSRRGPPERITAWFTRSESAPRLLQLQRTRRLQHDDRLTRTTTYARHDGLDLPASHRVDAEIEQRRRLRSYTLLLHAESTYAAPRIVYASSARR